MTHLSRRTVLRGTLAAVTRRYARASRLGRAALYPELGLRVLQSAESRPQAAGVARSGATPLGTRVEWVLSLGSNKANGFLAANAVQFGSTAGSAALLARVNGSPIRTVFLYSQPSGRRSSSRKVHCLSESRNCAENASPLRKVRTRTSFYCAPCTTRASNRATSRSSNCNIPTAAPHSNAVK